MSFLSPDMQFKKAAMIKMPFVRTFHGGNTVVSNEKPLPEWSNATNVPTLNLLYLQEILSFLGVMYIRDIYFCTTRFDPIIKRRFLFSITEKLETIHPQGIVKHLISLPAMNRECQQKFSGMLFAFSMAIMHIFCQPEAISA
jgi:hypothetical protein